MLRVHHGRAARLVSVALALAAFAAGAEAQVLIQRDTAAAPVLVPDLEAIRQAPRGAEPGSRIPDVLPGDAARAASALRPEVLDTLAERERREEDVQAAARIGAPELKIFGRDIFVRTTSQFQPLTAGPVDPDYRLGPGDQLVLVLSGDVELSHVAEVTREGTIIVPQVGTVVVQGLTMREVEDRLYGRLSTFYSGIGRGPGAMTAFNASLGRLRANQVFLSGEVERPGAYQVSSIGTAFSALYQARGPSTTGSFRNIEIRRGGEVVRSLDVYEYLLRGDSRNDIRLEQGDAVFVPLVGRQVAVRGEVRRPAIYELRAGEDLRTLLEFAGGLDAAAVIGRIQIDRILPPAERRPGVERVLVDVDLDDLVRGGSVQLQDRDLVHVFRVSAEQRNRVVLTGEVRRPGVYEWRPGARLPEVVNRAAGLTERAYTPRAHIYRLNRGDGTRFLVQATLLSDGNATGTELADGDSIVVYDRASLLNARIVYIEGLVKEPGRFELAEGMTVRDLILVAGGFARGADPSGVELARRTDVGLRSDTLSLISRVPLPVAQAGGASGSVLTLDQSRAGAEIPLWIPDPDEMILEDGDRVFVRRLAGFEEPRNVVVVGEAAIPGTYSLNVRQERLLDIISRAGGLTRDANPDGIAVVRDGFHVGTNYSRAARNPRSRENLTLAEGDTIVIPQYDGTVRVAGSVIFPSRVLYVPGRDLQHYISSAGGYTSSADRRRVSVTYADGRRTAVRRSLFSSRSPRVEPGALIFVPAQPEDVQRTDWGDVMAKSLQALGSVLTILIALDRLR